MNAGSLAGATILVVDDEEFIRDLVRKLLLDLGAKHVLGANSVAEAREVLDVHGADVDCIVSDFKMPGLTGIEFLQAVRSGEAGVPRNLPFAMLTAHGDKFVIGLAMALDVDAFIAKPVSKDTLSNRLGALLAQPRPELPPAMTYGGVSLGSSVHELENRVATLEGIIRELVRTNPRPVPTEPPAEPPAEQTADPDAAPGTGAGRSPVWTTRSPTPRPTPTQTPTAGQAPDQAAAPDAPDASPSRNAPPTEIDFSKLPSIAVGLNDIPENALMTQDLRSKDGRLILSAGSLITDRRAVPAYRRCRR